jgi:predicted SprT family Zn-dependent metalloprotease
MEREIVGNSINQRMPVARLQEVADHACRKYRAPYVFVEVEPIKGKVFGEAYQADARIALNSSYHGDNLGVLLHELAHWLTDNLYADVQSHGPTFMRVYSELLEQYKILPRDCLAVLAERYGVEIGEA